LQVKFFLESGVDHTCWLMTASQLIIYYMNEFDPYL